MAVHQAAARRTGHRVAAADVRCGHVCRNGKVVYGEADIWRLTRAASEKVLYINLSPSPKERSQNPPFKQSKENLEYLGNTVIITSATEQQPRSGIFRSLSPSLFLMLHGQSELIYSDVCTEKVNYPNDSSSDRT